MVVDHASGGVEASAYDHKQSLRSTPDVYGRLLVKVNRKQLEGRIAWCSYG